MRTKWEILQAKLADLEKRAADVRYYLETQEATDFGLPCGGCGVVLATERDFDEHFLVPDERFINLGKCPTKVV